MQSIPIFLMYTSYVSLLIPIYFLFRGKPYFTDNILKALSLLFFVAVFSDMLGYILIKTGRPNISIDNGYFIIQFFLLSYIYSIFLKDKKLVYVTLILFTGFVIFSTLFIQPFNEYQSWLRVVGGIALILYSLVCYIQELKDPSENERLNSLTLWVNMAILFYFSMNLYLFCTVDFILKNEGVDVAMLSWSFHNLCNITKNVLFAAGIYTAGRKIVFQ